MAKDILTQVVGRYLAREERTLQVLHTIKRLAELLKISPLSLLGIGVEYFGRPAAFQERLRQVEEQADQILQAFDPDRRLRTASNDRSAEPAYYNPANRVKQ